MAKLANNELSSKHRARIPHYGWCIQPHLSMDPSDSSAYRPFELPYFAMSCGLYRDQATKQLV